MCYYKAANKIQKSKLYNKVNILKESRPVKGY